MLPSDISEDFIIFIDESGDHSLDKIDPSYPIFVLVGCIFDTKTYKNSSVPQINQYKHDIFQTKDIILHSRDIRKRTGSFNQLMNESFREKFYHETNKLMDELQYQIICSIIKKIDLKFSYPNPISPYNLTLSFIMERYRHFLNRKRSSGFVIVESRGKKENKDLLDFFNVLMSDGTYYIKDFPKHIKGILFIEKSKNISGLQIADLCAYPLGRKVLNPLEENLSFNVIAQKLYDGFQGKPKRYGFKIFPQLKHKESAGPSTPSPTLPF